MLEYLKAIYYIIWFPFVVSVTLIVTIVIYAEWKLFTEDVKEHLLQNEVIEDVELTIEECNRYQLQILLPSGDDINVTVFNLNTLYNF